MSSIIISITTTIIIIFESPSVAFNARACSFTLCKTVFACPVNYMFPSHQTRNKIIYLDSVELSEGLLRRTEARQSLELRAPRCASGFVRWLVLSAACFCEP